MKMQILLDGQAFEGFTDATVGRSFINVSGEFVFTASPQNQIIQSANFQNYPLKTQRQCTILVNGRQFLTGYSDKISVFRSENQFYIRIAGRDRTMDLVDSTLDAEIVTEFTGNRTLEQICATVIEKLGIKDMLVINEAQVNTTFPPGDLINYNFGGSAFSFLSKYAAKVNALLTTDGLGNLVISNGTINPSTAQITPEILVNSALDLDTSKQYNRYTCYSQIAVSPDNFGVTPDSAAGNDNVGTITNTQIRKGRQYVFVANTPLLKGNAVNRAIWESNFRSSMGFRYGAFVKGFTFDGTNIWMPNQSVIVKDPFVGINSKMIIESVRFSESNGGANTLLSLVSPDAFQLKVEENYREGLLYGQADVFR